MLGAIAAVMLVVGAVSATVSVTDSSNQQRSDQSGRPAVEAQVAEDLNSTAE